MKIIHGIIKFAQDVNDILKELREINLRLARIAETTNKVSSCINDKNHRGQPSIVTGHWNDSHR